MGRRAVNRDLIDGQPDRIHHRDEPRGVRGPAVDSVMRRQTLRVISEAPHLIASSDASMPKQIADSSLRKRLPRVFPDRQAMNAKSRAILDRIESLEQAIRKAKEYLESGNHAQWSGFRPLFVRKRRDGREVPPNKDWVNNVFLPRMERALNRAERNLERLDELAATSPRDSLRRTRPRP